MANEATPSGDIFDVKKVRRLVELMKEHDLARSICGKASSASASAAAPSRSLRGPPPGTSRVVRARSSTGRGALRLQLAPRRRPPKMRSLQVIKSPMVGTFYTAANPESPPFVKVGDHVGPRRSSASSRR